jgi:hypothetical protein
MHTSTSKLYSLQERAYPKKLTPEKLELLKDISKSCHAGQTYANRPVTFQVRFPDDVIFNKELRLDLMTIDGRPVLHIIGTGTNFYAARFLPDQDTKPIWQTFLYAWVTIYTGYPSSMLTDQGSVFVGNEWRNMCKQVFIELRATGTESHNSLGQGETNHSILRRVYTKVSLTHPDQPSEIRLALAFKAMNDTAVTHGLVPSLLLFGVIPRIPGEEEIFPDQSRRSEEMEIAREEYRQIVSRSRVRVALQRKLPPAANYRFIHKQPVYVYREKETVDRNPLSCFIRR